MNLRGDSMDIVNICTAGLMLSSAALFAGNAVYDYKFGKKTTAAIRQFESGKPSSVIDDKMLAAIESVHGVFGREEDDVADVGEDYLSICTGVTLTDKEVPAFAAFLQAMSDVAKELDTTLDYTAEFTPAEMETFAAMIMDDDNGKIVPRYYRY